MKVIITNSYMIVSPKLGILAFLFILSFFRMFKVLRSQDLTGIKNTTMAISCSKRNKCSTLDETMSLIKSKQRRSLLWD